MHINPIQLFDTVSSTFTYILAAPGSAEAVIIDPVDHHWERDLRHLERLGLKLAWVLETHAHADHVTSAGKLRALTGARAAAPAGCGIAPADLQLQDGEVDRLRQRRAHRGAAHARPHGGQHELSVARQRLHRRHAR